MSGEQWLKRALWILALALVPELKPCSLAVDLDDF